MDPARIPAKAGIQLEAKFFFNIKLLKEDYGLALEGL